MHTIHSEIERPDSELVSKFDAAPSAVVSDATGNAGQAMRSEIDPIDPTVNLTGTALTVKASPADNLIIHKAITMAEPGDVLVIDGDGYTETAFLGELMCASCQANGLAGVVIDGAIRDRQEIVEMGFPLFARGTHPQGPLKQDPGSINVPITCGGVTVHPGDIIVGDGDGVTALRAAEAEAAVERIEAKIESEGELRQRVENGEYLYDIGGYEQVLEELEVVRPDESV